MASALAREALTWGRWATEWPWKEFEQGNTATTIVAGLATLYLVLYWLQTLKTHPNEPPVIPATVPVVGHLLGMALFGGRYMKGIGQRNRDKPIFTLPILFRSRIYMVTDPAMAATVQRASKTLSFTPLVPDITKRVLGLDKKTVEITRQHIDPEPGAPRGFLSDMYDVVYSHFTQSEPLHDISLSAARALSEQVQAVVARAEQQRREGSALTVNLLPWLQKMVTVATAKFLYGANNPLSKHPELVAAFWDFDHGLGALLAGVVPSVTARRPYRGREALAAGFYEYLSAGRHLDADACPLVRQRFEVALSHGWTVKAAARSEISFLFAGIVNTANTAFWMVLQLFAAPELLAVVREELMAGVEVGVEGQDEEILRLKLDSLRKRTPTLLSIFRECLRLGSDNYSTRLIKEDTPLQGGAYVLRAGNVVQIAASVMHSDKTVWGPDVDEFDACRFLRLSGKGNAENGEKEGSGVSNPPAAWRPFGGGKTLCPGRHFATNEILTFVAMFVLTFDLVGKDGVSAVEVPEKEDGVMPVHILEPKVPVEVQVRVRDRRKIVLS